jgi:septin family protein
MQQVPRYKEVCVNLIPNFVEGNVDGLTESHLHDIKYIVEEELLKRNIQNLTAALLQEAI